MGSLASAAVDSFEVPDCRAAQGTGCSFAGLLRHAVFREQVSG